jgi:membrane-bound lytic murein transglycosylase A
VVRSNLSAWGGAVWLTMTLAACQPAGQAPQQTAPPPVLQHISGSQLPSFRDDLDFQSLKQAIDSSLSFYDRLPRDRTFPFGERRVSVAVLRESLTHFAKILETGPDQLENSGFIEREFDIYRTASGKAGNLLVTGYYEPVLQGSLAPTARYRYPLYRAPPDLVTVELSQFDPKRFGSDRLLGRLDGERVVPYYTRAEIDGQGKLAQFRGQLAWLDDPLAVFFLHVQGSGVIRLEDGSTFRVGYAGANGRPYRSVGKLLLERGVIAPEDMSLQAIRGYLQQHPEELDEVLNYNESYVFFRKVTEGPVGNLGQLVTAGRSIATDHRHYPKGGLTFLMSEKTRLDANGRVVNWQPLHRWVLNQDAGGAIRGPSRIDLFCGTGTSAEAVAGPMKQVGVCYFLLKKGSPLEVAQPGDN